MCGSDGIEGKLMLGFGRLCKLGLIFLTADIALCGAALIPAYKRRSNIVSPRSSKLLS